MVLGDEMPKIPRMTDRRPKRDMIPQKREIYRDVKSIPYKAKN